MAEEQPDEALIVVGQWTPIEELIARRRAEEADAGEEEGAPENPHNSEDD